MTDKEAYEIMVKYSGGEEGIIKVRQMIHEIGVEETVNIMVRAYAENGKIVPDEFKEWMRQSYQYLSNLMSQPLN